jgi:O-acetyl-ADP-ribose deacetylase (regulator of RNase III)
MNHNQRLDFLLAYLLEEDPKFKNITIPKHYKEKKDLLTRLLKVRPATSFSKEFRDVYTQYLLEENRRMNLISVQDLTPVQPHVYLFDGDPHYLKTDCRVKKVTDEMDLQNHHTLCVEETNDPSYSHVIYTDSPHLSNKFTSAEYNELYKCYWESLEAAMANHCKTIAFDSFAEDNHNYPVEMVAQVAIHTVKEFRRLTRKSFDVVFNVAQKDDYAVYERLLGNRFM